MRLQSERIGKRDDPILEIPLNLVHKVNVPKSYYDVRIVCFNRVIYFTICRTFVYKGDIFTLVLMFIIVHKKCFSGKIKVKVFRNYIRLNVIG